MRSKKAINYQAEFFSKLRIAVAYLIKTVFLGINLHHHHKLVFLVKIKSQKNKPIIRNSNPLIHYSQVVQVACLEINQIKKKMKNKIHHYLAQIINRQRLLKIKAKALDSWLINKMKKVKISLLPQQLIHYQLQLLKATAIHS